MGRWMFRGGAPPLLTWSQRLMRWQGQLFARLVSEKALAGGRLGMEECADRPLV